MKVEAEECISARGSWLQADSDPSTWIGSWQRKTGNICDGKTSDSKVWRMTWLLGFRKHVLLHKLKHDYYVCSMHLPLFNFTFTGESDILRGSWPACGFHWTAQLLWEKEVNWDEEECWLTQISRLSLVLVRGWGVSRQLVHEDG